MIKMISRFEFCKTTLNGAYLIKPFYATDERGALIKDYNIDCFTEHGINHKLKEVFYTISKKGVIRALHFQEVKQQAKLVRCVSGHIYDVIVDLRPDSETFGRWESFDLSASNMSCVYVPKYFGHGYLVLEDSIVSYQCDEVFYGEYDSGIMWNDQDISIDWPFEAIGGEQNIIISDKDRNLRTFQQFKQDIYQKKSI